MGVSIDITEQKEIQQKVLLLTKRIAEEERQYRQAVTVYSGGMAHDLKNPIHVNGLAVEMIRGQVEMLKRQYNLPEEAFTKINQRLETIEGNHHLITQMIDDSNVMIQHISSDHPDTQVVLQDISIEKLIRESLTNYRDDVEKKLIHIDIRDNFELAVDKIFFFRIMTNLLENAKRQIQLEGKGKIFITALEEQAPSGEKTSRLCLVKDTAGGLTQEKINQFFDLYKTEDIQNTGLGLQGSRLLIEKMSGKVDVALVDNDCVEFRLSW